jgi:sulfur carrier protein ThiS
MMVDVRSVPEGVRETREMPDGARAMDLVRGMGLPTAACLVLRSGKPVPIDEPLEDGDELEVIYVASGG